MYSHTGAHPYTHMPNLQAPQGHPEDGAYVQRLEQALEEVRRSQTAARRV